MTVRRERYRVQVPSEQSRGEECPIYFILIKNNGSELFYRTVSYLAKKTTTKTDVCPGGLS